MVRSELLEARRLLSAQPLDDQKLLTITESQRNDEVVVALNEEGVNLE